MTVLGSRQNMHFFGTSRRFKWLKSQLQNDKYFRPWGLKTYPRGFTLLSQLMIFHNFLDNYHIPLNSENTREIQEKGVFPGTNSMQTYPKKTSRRVSQFKVCKVAGNLSVPFEPVSRGCT